MDRLVIIIGGDSGDGVQLLGSLLSENLVKDKYRIGTLPDFPAEIRSPIGMLDGVSGYKIQWGGDNVYTAGDDVDIFICFNIAAFKKYKYLIKDTTLLIYDSHGFDSKNCKLAQIDISEFEEVKNKKIEVPFSILSKTKIEEKSINLKDKNKNFVALGFLIFALNDDLSYIKKQIESKFKNKPEFLTNIFTSLDIGYNFADTIEFFFTKNIPKSKELDKENFVNIQGNSAIAIAIEDAINIFERKVLFAGYPITPASEILQLLSTSKNKNLTTIQSEDEISAVCMALGAGYAGSIGITASSGPGIDLKQETIGLAFITETPLLVIDIQRAGPSTGMPTKIEQSDLNMLYYGRHGDCPIPIIAIPSISLAYKSTLYAIFIALKFQTPVFLVSDMSIAIGSEPWKKENLNFNIDYNLDKNPHNRNADNVKHWNIPGENEISITKGGLENDFNKGGISYSPDNHQKMTEIRHSKIENINKYLENFTLEKNSANNGVLLLSWGSTSQVCKTVFDRLTLERKDIALGIIDWIRPFRKGFEDIIINFDTIILVELNTGQLTNIIQSIYLKKIHKITKIQGVPFSSDELYHSILKIIDGKV